jgi:hypothetical protein
MPWLPSGLTSTADGTVVVVMVILDVQDTAMVGS